MSKTISIAYQDHLDTGSTTLSHGLKITRQDAEVFAFTSADVDATIDGDVYRASPGLNVSNVVTTAGFAVDNLELSTIDDGEVFTLADIRSGRWVNAKYVLFKYNRRSLSDGTEPILSGIIGDVERQRGTIIGKLRGLQQYFQQTVGVVSSKTCRNRVGVDNGVDSRCGVNLAAFTYSGSVTESYGPQTFFDASFVDSDGVGVLAAGFFDEGLVTWQTGPNAGLITRVKSFNHGEFALMLPLHLGITPGDTFEVSAGCRKRLLEDCRDKFDNVLDFNGEPHRPLVNDLIKPAEPST